MATRDPETRRSSWLSILLVGCGGLLVAVGLIFLTLGVTAVVIVIGAGVFGLAAFHYLVWGWWLTRALNEEKEADRLSEGYSQWPPRDSER